MKQLLFSLLLLSSLAFSQEKLKNAKKSLSKQKTERSFTKNTKVTYRKSNNSSINNTDEAANPFVKIFGNVIFYSTVGLVSGRAEWRELNPYPYYNDYGEYTTHFSDKTKRSSFKLGSNYLFNTVKGIETTALFKPIPLVGIDVSYLYFSEATFNHNENFNIVSVMANYYRIRENYISFWWGLGATYAGNQVNTIGFSYALGTEIYPIKPISLHVSWKQSFINHNTIDVFKSQLKYHLKNTAIYTGYHNYQLGNQPIGGIVLGMEYVF
ncbi:hypothetical protein [Tenacibaculum sp. UWU-22]|uniref:hypothetical protein n=1 Tax=Tenacibaculum sp. UWU-22 TaxID=3234187 RepID=UPI0034DB3B12